MTEERHPPVEGLGVIAFAEPGALRDRLVELVLRGRKRATAALLSEWEAAGDPLEVGRRWAIVDSANRRVAVVQTTHLRIGTFADVDWDWIVDAGRGSRASSNGKRITSPCTNG